MPHESMNKGKGFMCRVLSRCIGELGIDVFVHMMSYILWLPRDMSLYYLGIGDWLRD